jgi:thiol-disulfide isomerase/thioredoxin
MKLKTIIGLSFLLTAAGCSNLENTPETQETSAPIASTAATTQVASPSATMPPFNMLTVDNKTINLSSFKGKKVFVNLWATWCPPCRAEIPSIEKLAAKTDKSKVAFVMLDLDNQFEKAISYAAKNKMKVPIYYPAENLPPLFNVDGIPTTFIFDEKGRLMHRQTGSVDYNTNKYIDLLTR